MHAWTYRLYRKLQVWTIVHNVLILLSTKSPFLVVHPCLFACGHDAKLLVHAPFLPLFSYFQILVTCNEDKGCLIAHELGPNKVVLTCVFLCLFIPIGKFAFENLLISLTVRLTRWCLGHIDGCFKKRNKKYSVSNYLEQKLYFF